MAGFTGWPDEGLDFLEDLVDNNERAWWLAHKDVYDRSVAGPMKALLEEVAATHGPGKVFRPQRDVRFTKDKTPYKTNVAAAVEGKDGWARYLSLDAWGLYVGAGAYFLEPDQLERYRRAVDDEEAGRDLERLAAKLEAQGLEVRGEALKRAPRGWPADHPRIRFLRHKGLYAGRQHGPEPWLSTPEAKARVLEAWQLLEPLCRWLTKHVGPSR